ERGPQARIARRPRALQDPAAQLAAPRRGHALQRGGQVEQIVGRLGPPALRLLEARLGGGGERNDRVADRRLRRPVRAARGPAPGDPELLPAPRLGREDDLLGEERREERDAGGVERIAEAGPDAVAGEEPEEALVIGAALARSVARRERVEEGARELGG